MEALITIENLKKVYTLGGEKVYALDGVDLTIYREEILCLLGTSGSGKSTLLNMMAGLDKPSSGKIYIGEDRKIDLTALDEKRVTKFRQKNVGFVFQSYNLISTLNATENVSLGMIFKGVNKKQREEKAEDILKKVGLGDRLKHRPQEMSGGQQQRVSIARAFVDMPKIVFADEPTGNLDTHTSFEIMNLMCSMAREHRQTLIIVTHDVETAVYADRIVEMRDGKIISIKENSAKIPKDITKEEIELIEENTLREIESMSSGTVSEADNNENDDFVICEDSSSEGEDICILCSEDCSCDNIDGDDLFDRCTDEFCEEYSLSEDVNSNIIEDDSELIEEILKSDDENDICIMEEKISESNKDDILKTEKSEKNKKSKKNSDIKSDVKKGKEDIKGKKNKKHKKHKKNKK